MVVRHWVMGAVLSAVLGMGSASYADESPVIEAMQDYLEFVDYGGGTILPRQIRREDWEDFHVIDARDAEQFKEAHIPGAVNIDWRQVLARRGEFAKDKMILLYCNSGTLSAQAAFALKVAGVDNVLVLQGGFSQWKADGGFDASKRAGAATTH